MSKIQYPEDWLGAESMAVIINYAELTKFCKANQLDSGHLSYLVRNIQDAVLGTVNRMLSEAVDDGSQSDIAGTNSPKARATPTPQTQTLREILEAYGRAINDGDLDEALTKISATMIPRTEHERELKKARLRGYNSGWVAASRVKPEKFAYFAKQLEDAAGILRNMEVALTLKEQGND